MFGKKGKGGPEMDMADCSTKWLVENAERWLPCPAATRLRSGGY